MNLPGWVAAVIFDCDGVLADTEAAWGRAEQLLCERHGAPFTDEIRAAAWGHSMPETVRILMPGVGEPGPLDDLRVELEELAAAEVGRSARALPGAAATVAACAAVVPVGVASNSPRAILDPVLQTLRIDHLVAASAAGDEVRVAKPHPEIYRRVARLLGVHPRDVLAFEDSPAGVRAAWAAGCTVVQVAGGRPRDRRARLTVPDLAFGSHPAGALQLRGKSPPRS